MFSDRLFTLSKWLLILIPILPLVYFSGLFYPFVTSKVILFRVLISLAFVGMLIAYVYGAKEKFSCGVLRKWPLWIPLAFLLIGYISSILGVDFYHSFWSIFDRLDGLVTLTFLTVYFYLIVVSFIQKDFYRMWFVAFVTAVLVALYGFLQRFAPGIESLIDTPLNRIGSTIGNAAFFSSYMLVLMFLSVFATLKTKRIWLRNLYTIGAVLFFLTQFISNTRGALLGILSGIGVMIIVSLFSKNISVKIKRVLAVIAIIGVLSPVAVFVARDTIVESNGPQILKRLAKISLTDTTTQSRLFVWKNSLKKVAERPLLGYGNEHVAFVYNSFYDSSIVSEEWFDRSHNVFIDVLVQNGILGFLTYLLMLGYMLKLILKYRYEINEKEAIVLIGLFVAYIVQNMFVFDTINTAIFFYALFAYLFFADRKQEEDFSTNTPKSLKPISVILAVFIIWSIYPVSIKPVQANIMLGESYTYMVTDHDRSMSVLEEGYGLNTFANREYGYQAFNMYFTKRNYLSTEKMEEFYDLATYILEKNIEKYPYDVRSKIYLSQIYENRPASRSVGEGVFEQLLQDSKDLGSLRSQPYYFHANIYLRAEAETTIQAEKDQYFNRAVEIIEEYIEKAPQFAESRIILANMYLGRGENEKAAEYIDEAELYYNWKDVSVARRFSEYFITTKQYSKAIPYVEKVVLVGKDGEVDYSEWLDLAKLYYFDGRLSDAVDILNIVYEKDEDLFNKNILFAQQVERDLKIQSQ